MYIPIVKDLIDDRGNVIKTSMTSMRVHHDGSIHLDIKEIQRLYPKCVRVIVDVSIPSKGG